MARGDLGYGTFCTSGRYPRANWEKALTSQPTAAAAPHKLQVKDHPAAKRRDGRIATTGRRGSSRSGNDAACNAAHAD
jgi:hypothetical protein